MTGMTIRTPTTATAESVSPQRTQAGSCCARRAADALTARALTGEALGIDMLAPALEEVDEDQHGERDGQQHDRDGRRLAVGELLEPRDDEDRRDLGLVGHVAGHEDDRAVFAQRA